MGTDKVTKNSDEKLSRQWIENATQMRLPNVKLRKLLKSGVILCSILNEIKPDTVPNIVTTPPTQSLFQLNKKKHPLIKENIEAFNHGCNKLGITCGGDALQVISFTDLEDDKFTENIIEMIQCIAFFAEEKGIFSAEGLRVAESHESQLKSIQNKLASSVLDECKQRNVQSSSSSSSSFPPSSISNNGNNNRPVAQSFFSKSLPPVGSTEKFQQSQDNTSDNSSGTRHHPQSLPLDSVVVRKSDAPNKSKGKGFMQATQSTGNITSPRSPRSPPLSPRSPPLSPRGYVQQLPISNDDILERQKVVMSGGGGSNTLNRTTGLWAEHQKLKADIVNTKKDIDTLKERTKFVLPAKYQDLLFSMDLVSKPEKDSGPLSMSKIDMEVQNKFLKQYLKTLLLHVYSLTTLLALGEEIENSFRKGKVLEVMITELQQEKKEFAQERKEMQSRIDELDELLTEKSKANSKNLEPPKIDGVVLQVKQTKAGDKKLVVKAGIVEKLIERLYSVEGPSINYMESFLLTYRSFTTPENVLGTIVRQYEEAGKNSLTNSDSGEEELERKRTRLRIVNFLKKWIDNFFNDFTEEEILYRTILKFCNTYASDKIVKPVKTAMEKKIRMTTKLTRQYTFSELPPSPIIPKKGGSICFDDVGPLEIARQITLIEYDMYKSILPKELLSLSWQKKDKKTTCPNLMTMINRFNLVGGWISCTIVSEQNLKKRASLLKKFVRILEELHKLNNYNGVFEVCAGLNSSSVNRLKKTWDEAGKDTVKTFEKISAVHSTLHNFSSYRENIHQINPPCIPYLGVYLSDLTFIEEGNPTYIKSDIPGDNREYVNYYKCRMVAEVIQEMQQYQQKPYNLATVLSISRWLSDLKPIDEKELFEASLQAEPRTMS